ncbi:MAG TPA: biotin/lipoyl-containing protein [Bradyrhizobium sp.]|jgi:acetyl-CoA carboxylase biotin carboxyl carrier protein
MTVQHIQQLASWLAEAGIDYLELSGPGQRLRLTGAGRGRSGSQAAGVADDTGEIHTVDGFVVKAPVAGTLLHRHPMQRTPLAPRGSRIRAGQTVALLQIGALLVPIEAPREGIVANLLVEDGTLVGFGTGIIRLNDIGSAT